MELFYYTSTDTMRFILLQGNIFATNIRYMNDSEEYINGLQEVYLLSKNTELVEKWIQQKGFDNSLLEKIHNVFSEKNLKENMQNMEYYSISFCKKNDLLSQWAIYAKESGVSIKMNFEEETYRFITKSIEKNNKAEWNLSPQKIYYFTYGSMKNKKIYNDVAYTILDQLYAENSTDQEWKKERWRYISTFVKRYDFYQEDEWRLIFEPNQSSYYPDVQYRHDNKVLKPYLDIECEYGWPIWEIMIGPGFNQSVVYNSVEHFLNHAVIKAGIKSVADYVKRLQQYFAPYESELKQCKEYNELNSLLLQENWITNVTMEEAKIFLNQQLREISKIVCESTIYDKDIKHYFKNNHFTDSGIILKRSSIPYIF